MERSNIKKLSEVIEDYLKKSPVGGKLQEVAIMNSWEDAVGKTIARHTTSLQVRQRKLYVKLNSSVVRNELLMIKDELVRGLNDRAGGKVIDEIVLR